MNVVQPCTLKCLQPRGERNEGDLECVFLAFTFIYHFFSFGLCVLLSRFSWCPRAHSDTLTFGTVPLFA